MAAATTNTAAKKKPLTAVSATFQVRCEYSGDLGAPRKNNNLKVGDVFLSRS